MSETENKRIVSPGDQLDAAVRSKASYASWRKLLSFEEKLRILVKLQEKAYFFGRTKFKPWPIDNPGSTDNYAKRREVLDPGNKDAGPGSAPSSNSPP